VSATYEAGGKVQHVRYGAAVVIETSAAGIRVRFDNPPADLDYEAEDVVAADDLIEASPYTEDETIALICKQLNLLFSPEDSICFTAIHPVKKTTKNAIVPFEEALSRAYIKKLIERNRDWNVYVAQNPLKEGSTQRTKESAGEVCNCFCEVDEDGEQCLADIRAAAAKGEIPKPSAIAESSPGKYQFVWRINSADFDVTRVEQINKALVSRFGSDPACTDVLRVFRVWALRNHKYPHKPVVRMIEADASGCYNFADFKITIDEQKIAAAKPPTDEAELCSIAAYFEEAAAEAKVNISSLQKWGTNGFFWEIHPCPWICEHTHQIDSGTVVLLHKSGALSFKCQHGHCAERTWIKDFRPKLEELVGHKLPFGNSGAGNVILSKTENEEVIDALIAEEAEEAPAFAAEVPAPPSTSSNGDELNQMVLELPSDLETQLRKEFDEEIKPKPSKPETSCLLFDSSEDVVIATRLGFNAASANDAAVTASSLREQYDHVALFGTSSEMMKLAGELNRTGYCAGYGVLPKDLTRNFVGYGGRVTHRACKSLVEAASHYTDEQLKEYLSEMLKLPFFQEYSLKVPRQSTGRREYPEEGVKLSTYADRYDMTAEEIAIEREKEYPVYRLLPPLSIPSFDEKLLYGPLGEMTKKICEYCETNPATVYLSLLVDFGNVIGRGPRFHVNKTCHYTNEYLAIVGPTSKGRKGTGRDVVDFLIESADSSWKQCLMGGVGSGQAVISRVRDGYEYQKRGRDGKPTTVIVPPVADKRLCIRSGELGRLFDMMGTDSCLSQVYRNAWDGKPLLNDVAGKTKDGESLSLRCQEPHVSVNGDITEEEMSEKLPALAVTDGAGNRTLFCLGYRAKSIAETPEVDWNDEIAILAQLISFARKQGYMPLTPGARKTWQRMYEQSVFQELPGKSGPLTSRAEAHIRRLAMILALADKESSVRSEHLLLARGLWYYCRESVVAIFTKITKDRRKVISYVAAAAAQKRSVNCVEIARDVFKWNKKVNWVKDQVAELVALGYLIAERDGTVRRPG
jgi:hypothetical protein